MPRTFEDARMPGYNPPGTSYTPPTSAFDVSTPGGLSAVTQYINHLNVQGQQAANRARIPGSQALEAQSSANIGQELHGAVPADVIRLLGQQSAERGAATGMGAGSGNEMAAYLQALGLTSLDLQHRGQQDLTAAYARNPAAPLFDPTTQLLTPYQQGNLSLQAYEADQRNRQFDENLELERERLGVEAANSFRRAGGGGGGGGYYGGGTMSPVYGGSPGFSGYGGEFTAPTTATGTYRNGVLYGPPSAADLLPSSSSYTPYYGPTGTGTGTYYAGSLEGYGGPGSGLPGEDFVSGGFIGSDSPAAIDTTVGG